MEKTLALLVTMASLNFAIRMLPFRMLRDRKLPEFFTTWLKYVPVPVLAAMLSSDLLIQQGRINVTPSNLYLVASIPTFLSAYLSRNLFVTVTVGVALLAFLRHFFV